MQNAALQKSIQCFPSDFVLSAYKILFLIAKVKALFSMPKQKGSIPAFQAVIFKSNSKLHIDCPMLFLWSEHIS